MKTKKRDLWPAEKVRKWLEDAAIEKLNATQKAELVKQAGYLHIEYIGVKHAENLKVRLNFEISKKY
jgi:hypothetical protein